MLSGFEFASESIEKRSQSSDLKTLIDELVSELSAADRKSREFWRIFYRDLKVGVEAIDALGVPSFEVAIGNVLFVGLWISMGRDFEAVLERINQFNRATKFSMYSMSGSECIHLSNESSSDFREYEWKIIESRLPPENVALEFRDCSGTVVPLQTGHNIRTRWTSASAVFLSSGTPLSSLVPTLAYFSPADCSTKDLLWSWNRDVEPSTDGLNSAEYEALFAKFIANFRSVTVITERDGYFQPTSPYTELGDVASPYRIFEKSGSRVVSGPQPFLRALVKALTTHE